MAPVWSKNLLAKILGREWSFGYNCYEVGHTWTPSCTGAALEVSSAAAVKVLPLYALLYGFSQLAVQQRLDLAASWDSAKSTARSTFFIFFHAYNGSILGCALRNSFGRFYYRVLVCAPALISSYLSLLIEKPSRRQALAFYLLNMASEILYRMAVTKGHFKPLAHGETLLFALSLGAWYYLLKTHGFGHDPVSAAVKVLIGREEAKSRSKRHLVHKRSSKIERGGGLEPGVEVGVSLGVDLGERGSERKRLAPTSELAGSDSEQLAEEEEEPAKWRRQERQQQQQQQQTMQHPSDSSTMAALAATLGHPSARLAALLDALGSRWPFGQPGHHLSCPHLNERTCLRYALAPIPSRFLIGYTIQSLLKLTSAPHLLLSQPSAALRLAFGSSASMRFGLFLGTLVSSGRLTACLLRHHTDSPEPQPWHGFVSGLVAGCSMLWAPRSSLSMYIMWKAVEQYYLLAAAQGRVKHFKLTIATIYAASAATILYTFALEPRFVRPSYMKFLDRLSDHRLHQLNRMVLDVFGTGSSIGYEDYFPDLDPRFMSNQFKELVFNWMIQPYE